ncbi:MAG: hypothetical protein MUF87_10365 [Anaerolineae bacterium]|nr:hypothetical protein [Anaerolineae bacterium]
MKLIRFVSLFALLIALFGAALVQAQDSESIEYNEPVEGEFTEDDFEFAYTFEGSEGDVIIARVDPVELFGDFDNSILILEDPNGDTVFDTTDAFSFGRSQAAAQLEEDGEYTLIVTREDGEDGESVGEYILEVVLAEELTLDEAVAGEANSEDRPQYYYVLSEDDFGLQYMRDGDFAATVTVNVISDEDTGAFDDVATLGGSEIEGGALYNLDADTLYVVTVGRGLFDIIFDEADTEFELMVIEAQ